MNKVLVVVLVPMLEKSYEVWIPINRKIHMVTKLLSEKINEMTEETYVLSPTISLYNRITGEKYPLNAIIKDTDIRNGSEIILF